MTKLNSFTEFQPLALRTESHIPVVKTNLRLLTALLVANVAITEILDGVKKQVFYGNPKKLFEDKGEQIATLDKVLEIIKEDLAPDSLEQEVDINPRVFHGLIGIITEAGELSDALLNGITGGGVDAVNIQEEATGDIGWYQAILNDELGLDQYQGLTNVINKLRVRYPDKFSNELAANRNLDAERKELEVK
jgi:hypothetical protein